MSLLPALQLPTSPVLLLRYLLVMLFVLLLTRFGQFEYFLQIVCCADFLEHRTHMLGGVETRRLVLGHMHRKSQQVCSITYTP